MMEALAIWAMGLALGFVFGFLAFGGSKPRGKG